MKFSAAALLLAIASTVDAFVVRQVAPVTASTVSTSILFYRPDAERDLFQNELMDQDLLFQAPVAPPKNRQEDDTSAPLKGRDVVDAERRLQLAQAGMAAPDVWNTSAPRKIQGRGAVKTWSIREHTERVQVLLKARNSMPLKADLEVWNGPDNTPLKLHVVSENGSVHPLSLVLNTPDMQNAIAIKNMGLMEFPMESVVLGDSPDAEAGRIVQQLGDLGEAREINGEAMESFPFAPQVEAVQILLKTDGRPLHARLELTQGPGHVKQYVDVFSENGLEQPLFCVLDTPGVHGATIRVVNTGTLVFPLTVSCSLFFDLVVLVVDYVFRFVYILIHFFRYAQLRFLTGPH